MAYNDKFHINPKTGSVDRCRSVLGQCPFGSTDQHFRDESIARRASEAKFQSFHDWTDRSAVPQREGWYTEHVFDPSRPETMEYFRSFLEDVPQGTHLVMENGWVLEKSEINGYWNLVDGEDDRIMGLKKDEINDQLKFTSALASVGGRLEFTDGVQPIRMNWRS